MTERVPEKEIVAGILRYLPQRPAVDRPTEAALVDFDPNGNSLLAVAADSLSEEISTGLYFDRYTLGWVSAMSPASDLAAAGARLLGLSLMLNLPEHFEAEDRAQLARGFGDACRTLGTIVLGGDTNQSRDLVVSACAVGVVPKDRVISRAGARPGDVVYLSGRAGLGNAYALVRFGAVGKTNRFTFLPQARIKLGGIVRQYASCSMDTSDGVLITLDELSCVNDVGFVLTSNPASVLHPRAIKECERMKIPEWLVLAGCHGEFELVFTIPPKLEEQFLAEASRNCLCPKRLGHVTERKEVVLAWGGGPGLIDTGWIRDRAAEAATDVRAYIASLVEYARKVGS